MLNFKTQTAVCLYLICLMIASPATAVTLEELERQYAVAERKLKKICVKHDALREKLVFQQSEQRRLKEKIKILKRKAGQEIYTRTKRAFINAGHSSDVAADLADGVARGELGPRGSQPATDNRTGKSKECGLRQNQSL
ncbi:MAG: hypothetical protein GY952_14815 [Rhodobacteraceae bacterium]|nr:hypothetical protein [Paracoccaceae bacterium]